MSSEEQYEDTTRRCTYWGEPKVKWYWSTLSRGQYYCSLECQVKAHKTITLVSAFCCLPIMILLSIEFALSLPPLGNQRSNVLLLLIRYLLLLLDILVGYQLYLALKPRKRARGL